MLKLNFFVEPWLTFPHLSLLKLVASQLSYQHSIIILHYASLVMQVCVMLSKSIPCKERNWLACALDLRRDRIIIIIAASFLFGTELTLTHQKSLSPSPAAMAIIAAGIPSWDTSSSFFLAPMPCNNPPLLSTVPLTANLVVRILQVLPLLLYPP